MLQSISWLQFGLFLLLVGGGYYLCVLVVFYRKEVWNYVSGKKVQPIEERGLNGRSSAPGSNSDKAPGEGSDRGSGVASGGARDKYLSKKPVASGAALFGRPVKGRVAAKRPGTSLRSPAVGGWQGIVSGSEDAIRRGPAEYQDVAPELDDADDLADDDLMRPSRRAEKNEDEWWHQLEEEAEELGFTDPGFTGPVGKERTREEQRDMLFRAMGTVIVQLKEVVRRAKEDGTDRESLTGQLSDVLRNYGQLKGTSYQAGINNFLTRTCSTNFSLLLGAEELEVMWN